jgi:dethiobiotin synthetase
MKGLFITGTDTGVGKTTIAAGLAQWFRRRGRAVRVSKPVATGAQLRGERWVSEDTQRLAAASGLQEDWEAITAWSFPEPVAPPVAARRHGVHLTLLEIVRAIRQQSRPDSVLLVEGIGGLLCPLTETETVADLAGVLDLPLVIVTRRSLGTLNHTLLTLEAAKLRGLNVAGVVINETEPPRDLAAQTNPQELRHWIDVPILGLVSFGADAAAALDGLEWERLAERRGSISL